MNWKLLRRAPWLDTRAQFVWRTPRAGRLLDVGSSDGETLGHFAELRPDLQLLATDIAGQPERYPKGCEFHRGDIQNEALPWAGATIDAITCMHVVEHLEDLRQFCRESARLLRPGGRIYLETPHPKSMILSSPPAEKAIKCTVNFFDDLTHTLPVTIAALGELLRGAGLEVTHSGRSRNWLITAAYPFYILLPASRRKYVSYLHWTGWNVFVVGRKKH
jgi:2-polyprenyl-3-methyl-5-hydroxy-6-metoxy-1,4-benzoquinol methylase